MPDEDVPEELADGRNGRQDHGIRGEKAGHGRGFGLDLDPLLFRL